mmetsp:Transcript_46992/g.123836  ORF Transcript_46992/g.123836 Transcript_46992/m.123836 type:complete len:216 (+) Transcript_46992:42-689(+)
MYVGDEMYAIGKDPIAGGKKSYPGNPAVVRGSDGVLRNRGEYDASGKMIKAMPLSSAEFHDGVPEDELKLVYEDGAVVSDQCFFDIKNRVAIKDLEGAITKAVDNLLLKVDFLQSMTTKEAIAVRLAEAACGSKWMHKHPTKLAAMTEKFPDLELGPTYAKLGLTPTMDSEALLAKIKADHMCDKKAAKKVLAALDANDPDAALAARGDKAVVTL